MSRQIARPFCARRRDKRQISLKLRIRQSRGVERRRGEISGTRRRGGGRYRTRLEISAFTETMSMSLRPRARGQPLFASQTRRVIIISVGANEALVFWRPPDRPPSLASSAIQTERGGKPVVVYSGRKINFTDCK